MGLTGVDLGRSEGDVLSRQVHVDLGRRDFWLESIAQIETDAERFGTATRELGLATS